ncbi:hypothetical protein IE81DRAFT_33734 [Ceraceosorus guamensis]|uniref:Secreted protein n=1 Tax=Ceraceosorus guamensis TaxID=1522189 RepID=A0A316VP32_9BASI|nr:hypothetical protein IE81DRAFT_33734 [Ceraceosorus guamensis]PWN39336.1 hypothetical protein IE81DRAFT_33734 [Ceraceosorus guamensis]
MEWQLIVRALTRLFLIVHLGHTEARGALPIQGPNKHVQRAPRRRVTRSRRSYNNFERRCATTTQTCSRLTTVRCSARTLECTVWV